MRAEKTKACSGNEHWQWNRNKWGKGHYRAPAELTAVADIIEGFPCTNPAELA